MFVKRAAVYLLACTIKINLFRHQYPKCMYLQYTQRVINHRDRNSTILGDTDTAESTT